MIDLIGAIRELLRRGLGLTTFQQESAAATDVDGTNWKTLLDKSTLTLPVNIYGFKVTKGGAWAGNAKIRIVTGAGTKIFPFQAEYIEGTDFVDATQAVFNFVVNVPANVGYIVQFRSSNAGDGAGETLTLNNLDVATVTNGTITNVTSVDFQAAATTALTNFLGTKPAGWEQAPVIKTIDLNQAAGDYTVFTGTTQNVELRSLRVKLPAAAAGGAVTSIAILIDDDTEQEIISTKLVAVMTSEAEWSFTGSSTVKVGSHIVLRLGGGAHGAEYLVSIKAAYSADVSGGYLS